jgi:ribonuclease Z
MTVRDLITLGCSSQQPTRFRNHGAYLLRWNNKGFLFDPGEGTQRQFIHADVPPPTVTHILISHFHGDHCLGLGSMLMRLNLDKVKHPIHCYYPASGKRYFDALRYGCIYHEKIQVIEHPVSAEGMVSDEDGFKIEAYFLNHGVDCIGWRITEADRFKYDPEKLERLGIHGPQVQDFVTKGFVQKEADGPKVYQSEVGYWRRGDTFAYVLDTRYCQNALKIAQGAKMLLCESTYLAAEKELAHEYAHMTTVDAATIAKEANVQELVLTHFSARYPHTGPFLEEAQKIFPNTKVAKDLRRFDFPLEQISEE